MVPGLQDLAGSFKKLVASDDKVASIKQTMAATAAANGTTTMAAPHPLDALSPDEISRVGTAIRKHFTEVSKASYAKIWEMVADTLICICSLPMLKL